VLVAPSRAGENAAAPLLARAATPLQETFFGNQAGERVFLFLKTDDFWRDYEATIAKVVRFVRAPAEQSYGTVAVFWDLYAICRIWCSPLTNARNSHPRDRHEPDRPPRPHVPQHASHAARAAR
jgi:hypothetical protein